MTVTKGRKKYSFPVNSGNSSDVESMHLGSVTPSDTESLNNEPSTVVRPFAAPFLRPIKNEELSLKRNSGRKKLRRYQNRCLLQTLAEEDDEEGTLVVIMEPYQSPFARLLENDDALEFWNAFICKSEDEQAEVIASLSEKHTDTDKSVKEEKPFSRILAKIKRTFKIKKNPPWEQVKESEQELIAFFKSTPNLIFSKCLSSYFERLSLHAIAQYHGLHSLGVVENGCKRIDVFNTLSNWEPVDCFMADYLANWRKR